MCNSRAREDRGTDTDTVMRVNAAEPRKRVWLSAPFTSSRPRQDRGASQLVLRHCCDCQVNAERVSGRVRDRWSGRGQSGLVKDVKARRVRIYDLANVVSKRCRDEQRYRRSIGVGRGGMDAMRMRGRVTQGGEARVKKKNEKNAVGEAQTRRGCSRRRAQVQREMLAFNSKGTGRGRGCYCQKRETEKKRNRRGAPGLPA